MTSYNCLLGALCLAVGVGVVKGLTITSDPGALANKTFTHVVIGGGTAGTSHLKLIQTNLPDTDVERVPSTRVDRG